MRLTFLILLITNVVLFFLGQGYLSSQDTGREPARLTQQVGVEKLTVTRAK